MMGISGILHFKIDICIYWCVCMIMISSYKYHHLLTRPHIFMNI